MAEVIAKVRVNAKGTSYEMRYVRLRKEDWDKFQIGEDVIVCTLRSDAG